MYPLSFFNINRHEGDSGGGLMGFVDMVIVGSAEQTAVTKRGAQSVDSPYKCAIHVMISG